MNLKFAMDDQVIREVIASGDIALCPIRQIGKTNILLRHISLQRVNLAVVIAHTIKSAEQISDMWIKFYNHPPRTPSLLIGGPCRFLTHTIQGLSPEVPVYFDEYMLLEDKERKDLYDVRKRFNFSGGVATYR